jgi:hypothetical protein
VDGDVCAEINIYDGGSECCCRVKEWLEEVWQRELESKLVGLRVEGVSALVGDWFAVTISGW